MDEIIIEQEPENNQKQKSNVGQGLGIIGLVLGVLSTMLAFIPCVGLLALVPGIIGLAFAVIGLAIAYQSDYRGLLIAALVISLIGTSVASIQVFIISGVARSAKSFADHTHSHGIVKDAGLTADDIFDKYNYDKDAYGNFSEESFEMLYGELEDLFEKAETTVTRLEDGKVLATRELPGILKDGANLFTRCDTLEPYFTMEQRNRLQAMEDRFEQLKTRLMAFGY